MVLLELLAQYLITIWAAVGKLLQRTVSRVILEINQASGPRGNLQIRLDSEQAAFCQGEWVLYVAELRESCQPAWKTATSDQQGLPTTLCNGYLQIKMYGLNTVGLTMSYYSFHADTFVFWFFCYSLKFYLFCGRGDCKDLGRIWRDRGLNGIGAHDIKSTKNQ